MRAKGHHGHSRLAQHEQALDSSDAAKEMWDEGSARGRVLSFIQPFWKRNG